MLVRHQCFYLTNWNGITPRQEDWSTSKIVKCLKGEPVKGYFKISIAGAPDTYNESNKALFLERVWYAMGAELSKLPAPHALVPIPNATATVDAPDDYRTLNFVRAIAAASGGKVEALDA